MDPLCSVFSITGSDTGSMNGDILVHPGDSASPLEIIEWLDRVDERKVRRHLLRLGAAW